MRIARIADTHLSARSPECVANWHAARQAIGHLGADLTIHLGDITLDAQTRAEELAFASRLVRQWPNEMLCLPGNHDLGDGSGEQPLDHRLLDAYTSAFGPDRWAIKAGDWKLLGINAQLLGTDSPEEACLWDWIEQQAAASSDHAHTALFLHRPLLRLLPGERVREGRYVRKADAARLLTGPLKATLRLVVSGHTHQYLDTAVDGVRHVWMPSSAFIIPDEIQARIGEKLIGLGLLDLSNETAQFHLWCPEGLTRHDVTRLKFFQVASSEVATEDA